MSDKRPRATKATHRFRTLPSAELTRVRGGILHAAMDIGASLFDMGVAAPHSDHENRGMAGMAQRGGGALALLQGISQLTMGHGGMLAAGTGHGALAGTAAGSVAIPLMGGIMGGAGGISAGMGIDSLMSDATGGHTVSGGLASLINGGGSVVGGGYNLLNNLWGGEDVDFSHAGDTANAAAAPVGGLLPAALGLAGSYAGVANPVLGGAIGLGGTLIEGIGMASNWATNKLGGDGSEGSSGDGSAAGGILGSLGLIAGGAGAGALAGAAIGGVGGTMALPVVGTVGGAAGGAIIGGLAGGALAAGGLISGAIYDWATGSERGAAASGGHGSPAGEGHH
jgi:hypothetical protein